MTIDEVKSELRKMGVRNLKLNLEATEKYFRNKMADHGFSCDFFIWDITTSKGKIKLKAWTLIEQIEIAVNEKEDKPCSDSD